MKTLMLLAAALFAGVAGAEEPPSADTAVDPDAERRHAVRQMRLIIEQEQAQANAAARASAHGLHIETADSPGIGAMREQLARSLERLEERCFGMQNEVQGGNLIVICGDNSGRAENANVHQSHSTHLLLPASDSQPATPPAPAKEGT